MGPEGAVNIIFRKQIEAADDPDATRAEMIEGIRKSDRSLRRGGQRADRRRHRPARDAPDRDPRARAGGNEARRAAVEEARGDARMTLLVARCSLLGCHGPGRLIKAGEHAADVRPASLRYAPVVSPRASARASQCWVSYREPRAIDEESALVWLVPSAGRLGDVRCRSNRQPAQAARRTVHRSKEGHAGDRPVQTTSADLGSELRTRASRQTRVRTIGRSRSAGIAHPEQRATSNGHRNEGRPGQRADRARTRRRSPTSTSRSIDGAMTVEVKSAGIAFPDLLMTRGLYQYKPEPPFVLGSEGAGVVSRRTRRVGVLRGRPHRVHDARQLLRGARRRHAADGVRADRRAVVRRGRRATSSTTTRPTSGCSSAGS